MSVWCARQCSAFRSKSVELRGESYKAKAHAKAHARLTEKLKYFHGFLTFTDEEYTCEM